MVGEIISEWGATSNRNGGRDHSGIVGDIERNQQARNWNNLENAARRPSVRLIHEYLVHVGEAEIKRPPEGGL